ncbi:MAG: hypothetical protein E6I48_17370 [Chloroflexi bacterium]|nr:MAG: hypothetical protein E6I48_17370 [Chloroflexota bacterium]
MAYSPGIPIAAPRSIGNASRSTNEIAIVSTVRVADYLIGQLPRLNVDRVFAITGGGAMHLDDALRSCADLQVIFNQHEQACAIAAEGYARTKRTLGVAVVTSGPGGTNCVTLVAPTASPASLACGTTPFQACSCPARSVSIQPWRVPASRCVSWATRKATSSASSRPSPSTPR